MKTSINFKIQRNNSSVSGSAAIVDLNSTYPWRTLCELASEEFGERVKIRFIGVAEQEESDGYVHQYDIYESYRDAGSNDYSYYAINTGCYEK